MNTATILLKILITSGYCLVPLENSKDYVTPLPDPVLFSGDNALQMFFQPASSQEKENFINFFVCKK
jgi:hypothetical protein